MYNIRILYIQLLDQLIRQHYGNEVWECNKGQANALESIILGSAKKILGCSSRTCHEAVRGDMGIDTGGSTHFLHSLPVCIAGLVIMY